MGFLEKSIKKKFRYKVLSEIIYTNKELMDFLNDQGDIGWEAVNVESSDEARDNAPNVIGARP